MITTVYPPIPTRVKQALAAGFDPLLAPSMSSNPEDS